MMKKLMIAVLVIFCVPVARAAEDAKVYFFWLHVSPQDRDKCRDLHKLLAIRLTAQLEKKRIPPIKNKEIKADYDRFRSVVRSLGVKQICHENFTVNVGCTKAFQLEGFSEYAEHVFMRSSNYEHEDIRIVLEDTKSLQYVQAQCNQLPYEAELLWDFNDVRERCMRSIEKSLIKKYDYKENNEQASKE